MSEYNKEIRKINESLDKFGLLMKKRMRDKCKEGYKGWDNSGYKALIQNQMRKDMQHYINRDKLIDIANRSMMLYFMCDEGVMLDDEV